MRLFGVCATFLLTIAVVAAQAPAGKRTAAAKPAARAGTATARPDGDLAQLMRGILFPNSNLLFDVQENDPAGSAARCAP